MEAYEIEPGTRGTRAVNNLAPWQNVTVHAKSATGPPLPEADAIYVSAGATHPRSDWLDALRDGGRLLFPLTGSDQSWGGMLLVDPEGQGFAARFLSKRAGSSIVPALRDPATAGHLT